MAGLAARTSPYALAFFSSLCIMILELVSSRLVARHVGSSLTVWNSVIGIILGGICLGNVLGGRLADRVEPRRAVGPLFALGSFLTFGALAVNATIPSIVPSPQAINWELRTILVVTLDFLLPATVLGMVGPVVAKMAVELSRKAGSAIGDVYFWGAVGSIVGTFLAGFVLIYLAPTSVIVLVVAAALALLAAILDPTPAVRSLATATAALFGAASVGPLVRTLGIGGIDLGGYQLNYLAVLGGAASLAMAVFAARALWGAPRAVSEGVLQGDEAHEDGPHASLRDLAILAFIASLAFMAMEMVAGRLVTRHLGSSVYGWTSVIGVLLAGLSVGNYLGGRVANGIQNEKQASWLFLISSVAMLLILFLDNQPQWFRESLENGPNPSVLSHAIVWNELDLPGMGPIPLSWPFRVLLVVFLVFFLPAVTMGTVSPVVAKLAVDRLRRHKRTGTAIGQVYAWGMVGSILGTFLTGFVLIDVLGTKGVLLLLAAVLALTATILGSVLHAVWAGIPLGLCVIGFLPMQWTEKIGEEWSIREPVGDPNTTQDALAYADESNYYYIKVNNEPESGGVQLRTLVLDNLIHGYFILGHPERLDYDYEHIYAMVAYRSAKASGKITRATPASSATAAEGGPLPDQVFADAQPGGTKPPELKAAVGESDVAPADEVILESPSKSWMPRIEKSTLKTLFLGGGAYTFQRHVQHVYPGTEVDVAEIDPAVTRANHAATGLPVDTPIHTSWGDARQFVERNQDDKQYDIVFGDAFNDFSVPWHLTTREFNEKIAKMLAPTGVYMINIIDAYESDAIALKKAEKRIETQKIVDPDQQERVRREHLAAAHRFGGFLGSWTATAKLTFPHVYIFGTSNETGEGQRETFVVVAAKQPLDLADLGRRDDDPRFFQKRQKTVAAPYGPDDEKAVLESRSRGIILTDDYAPVENLLAPVAETRGQD
ncbi:fused MFS/spermidine synthase [Planctomyces sp. SH-PL62]|uniref:fused MFS/spermidine synthase n=1 Tax=Planctomyces sp. SH-PL62 TaxID=1636152 RepID=UPI00078DDC26|nr:fused MFS/spermidine synthase [Planctomyces sp. SH-PL62]AMV36818.1 spermidine synthase [Planctomyces sp. SH-PL62]